HDLGEAADVRAEALGRAAHERGALGEARPPPRRERPRGRIEARVEVGVGDLLEPLDQLAGGGVYGLEGHEGEYTGRARSGKTLGGSAYFAARPRAAAAASASARVERSASARSTTAARTRSSRRAPR